MTIKVGVRSEKVKRRCTVYSSSSKKLTRISLNEQAARREQLASRVFLVTSWSALRNAGATGRVTKSRMQCSYVEHAHQRPFPPSAPAKRESTVKSANLRVQIIMPPSERFSEDAQGCEQLQLAVQSYIY